jgi:hypothetical protein
VRPLFGAFHGAAPFDPPAVFLGCSEPEDLIFPACCIDAAEIPGTLRSIEDRAKTFPSASERFLRA